MRQKELDQLLEKIQKLLLLSESPNESEAGLAAAKVQELLQRYNLDEAQVRGYQSSKSIQEIEVPYLNSIKWVQAWEVRLIGVLAEAYFCRVLFNRYAIYILGRPLDTEVTRDVGVRVRKVLYDLSFQRLNEYTAEKERLHYFQTGEKLDKRTLGRGERSQEFRRGWLQGALEGVATQVYYQQKKFEDQTSSNDRSLTGRELIVLRNQELEDRISGKEIAQLPDIGEHGEGLSRGRSDGLRTSLHRGDLEQK